MGEYVGDTEAVGGMAEKSKQLAQLEAALVKGLEKTRAILLVET